MKRQNFIPISSAKIIDDLCVNNDELRELFQLLKALYQFNFYKKLEAVKQHYQNFDPDSDLVNMSKTSGEKTRLLQDIDGLLTDANYQVLTIQDIERSISAQMQSGLNIEINLEDFDVLKIYTRSTKYKTIWFRHWNRIKKQSKQVLLYQRVLLVIKLKNIDEKISRTNNKKTIKKLLKNRKKLPPSFSDEFIFIKLFKDIAQNDLEMLFHNRKIKLKTLDKIRLSLTSGVGTALGVVSTTTKIIAAASNIFSIVIALGVLFKQIMNIFNKRTQYIWQPYLRSYIFTI